MVTLESESDKNTVEFIIGNLLKMAQERDLSDEMGRRELTSFMSKCLSVLESTVFYNLFDILQSI